MSDRGCCYHRSNKLYSLARLLDPRTVLHTHTHTTALSMCLCVSPLVLWAGVLQCCYVCCVEPRVHCCCFVRIDGKFSNAICRHSASGAACSPSLSFSLNLGLHILVFGTQINFVKNSAKTFEPARLHFNFDSKLANSISYTYKSTHYIVNIILQLNVSQGWMYIYIFLHPSFFLSFAAIKCQNYVLI